MLPEKYQWVAVQFEPGEGDPRLLLEIARSLEEEGNLEGAATVYDRAYGLDPTDEEVRQGRWRVLGKLAVEEHGLLFRYVPGGPFLMGNNDGDADERPWHPVWLSPFWISETPISWAAYCRLMSWQAPPMGYPQGFPPQEGTDFDHPGSRQFGPNKIRLQYCEDFTTRAVDWHEHSPGEWSNEGEEGERSRSFYGSPPRTPADAPRGYDTKPMVAVDWHDAIDLAGRLSTGTVSYTLPSEAQWEKAARGGLIGARFAWGDDRPTPELCDFDRYHQFSILPMRSFAPNGYGLFAMNGCVWEWTRDWYDRHAYHHHGDTDPNGPAEGQEKVLRGGSWADCADVLTVSFRMSLSAPAYHDLLQERRESQWGMHLNPNIGFRLCRMTAGEPPASGPP
jgi:formylglycine-generating enzyme required for sulfatase activity